MLSLRYFYNPLFGSIFFLRFVFPFICFLGNDVGTQIHVAFLWMWPLYCIWAKFLTEYIKSSCRQFFEPTYFLSFNLLGFSNQCKAFKTGFTWFVISSQALCIRLKEKRVTKWLRQESLTKQMQKDKSVIEFFSFCDLSYKNFN